MKIIYVVNCRLPTEKAHGHQVVKMCEAFSQNGADIQLWHPLMRQSSELKNKSIFEYYNVIGFKEKTLINFDVIVFDKFFSKIRLNVPIALIQSFVWGFYAVLKSKKERADVYYTRDLPVTFWLLIFNLPTIYEEHVIPNKRWEFLLRFFAKQTSLKLVVALTGFIQKHYLDLGFNKNKVIVLSDAVDLKMFLNLPTKLECREKLNLPHSIIVGYIGRFRVFSSQEKGIPELINAISYLSTITDKNISLLLVGGPKELIPYYLDMAEKANLSSSQIKFVNQVSVKEVPLWIRACDVVTIPWTWTQFSAYCTSPLKLFEYMASKTPIVASDLPSLREVLNENNSILVKPGDYKDLARGIQRVLTDKSLSDRISERAYNDVQNYTWDNRAKKILSLLCT